VTDNPTAELTGSVQRWIADDPDPASRQELAALLAALPGSAAELANRFAERLTFGTAGLRGPLRAGPNGMNVAVVRAAAAGLVSWLSAQGATGPLVIGYDARHGSREFARETARVATGAGRAALMMPRVLPTPVLAYAVRALGAAAGVMVTASHNPAQDNGYKVYLGNQLGGIQGGGGQIVPPVDTAIEAAIQAVGPLAAVPLGDEGQLLGEDVLDGYLRRVVALIDPDGPRDLAIAYTPLHGVGGQAMAEALRRAGFPAPKVVAEQAEPDPSFPTVHFPNPEEPGAMDRVIALAASVGADIAIANDPDADRCACAVPVARPASDPGNWRMLRGDEVGVLLADHLMRRGRNGLYATTIVSSTMLRAMCSRRGQAYDETLTGFKWIIRAGDGQTPLVFGYEEALGYSVAPDLVRDKDGISAALMLCELAAGLKAQQRGLPDRLTELAEQFGVYATDQLAVRVDDLADIAKAMARLRAYPPTSLLGEPITDFQDRQPESDVVILRANGCRVVVRPSGTEPKLKAYLEIHEPPGDPVAGVRARAAARLAALRIDVARALGL
jgi:phosphomannomutase